jgi:hypothetical protein
MSMERSRPAPGDDNVAQLKRDIDSGRTGDKVATPDPGLSALGTDAEASGHPATPEQVATDRRQERAIAAGIGPDEAHPTKAKRIWPIVFMVGTIVVIALVIAAKVLSTR